MHQLPRSFPLELLIAPESDHPGGKVIPGPEGWVSIQPDGTREVIHEYVGLDQVLGYIYDQMKIVFGPDVISAAEPVVNEKVLETLEPEAPEEGTVLQTNITMELLHSLDMAELRKIGTPIGAKHISKDGLIKAIAEKLGLK